MHSFFFRYPEIQDTFVTVTNSTYKEFNGPIERPSPYRPPIEDSVKSYIHPEVISVRDPRNPEDVSYKPVEHLSTVSRRTYIAPEVMKFFK